MGAIRESPLQHHGVPNPTEMTITERRNMTLSKLVGRFKMVSAKRVNALCGTTGRKLWQRNYWEHIVRNDDELNRIRAYIRNNPSQWHADRLCDDHHDPKRVCESTPEYPWEPWMV